jgi:hypothetical protein
MEPAPTEDSVMRGLEIIIQDKRTQIERNSYSKSIPLARFYDVEKLKMMDAIYAILKNFQERIDSLEKK